MASPLDDTLRRHRRRIIEREEAAFRELLDAYAVIERELREQFKDLEQKILAARAAGEEISPSWLFRERRLRNLIDQVKQQVERFGGTAAGITSREQRAAVRIAVEQAAESFRVAGGSANVGNLGTLLPTQTIENAVGLMGNGAPILEYYRENLAPKVAEMIRVEVIKAVATGTDFKTIARRLMTTGQITKSRALMVARTEVNRVRRETTRQIFEDNSDIISGWEWVAAKSPLTCVVCLALDGRVFKVKDPFPQHPNCRCTLIAVIKGVDRPKRTLGKEWFENQPDEIKAKILGVDGLAAYKEGLIDLEDFIGWRNHAQFGKSVYSKPLIKVLADKPIAERVIRTPTDIEVLMGPGVNDRLEEILGEQLSTDQIGGLVGALDGSKIEAATDGESVFFRVLHPLVYRQERELGVDGWGSTFMYNHHFRKSRTAPRSIGLKSFATQVMHAERFGIERIETYAAGNFEMAQDKAGFIGYYNWPRSGYNARLTPADWDKFPETFRGIHDLNDLFLQTNGKFVWKYKGTAREMLFDLDRNARSWRILEAYLQERGFTIRFH